MWGCPILNIGHTAVRLSTEVQSQNKTVIVSCDDATTGKQQKEYIYILLCFCLIPSHGSKQRTDGGRLDGSLGGEGGVARVARLLLAVG